MGREHGSGPSGWGMRLLWRWSASALYTGKQLHELDLDVRAERGSCSLPGVRGRPGKAGRHPLWRSSRGVIRTSSRIAAPSRRRSPDSYRLSTACRGSAFLGPRGEPLDAAVRRRLCPPARETPVLGAARDHGEMTDSAAVVHR